MRTYFAIDLKSFYASVECVERNLDPLDTNLVVADSSRTEKTICLAVSPMLKQHGIPGRARLFEVVQRIKEVNIGRKNLNGKKEFLGKSFFDSELKKNKNLELDYIVATPQMEKYIKISTQIYNIYKRFVSEDDIVVYSIDEVFIDATDYLKIYNLSAKDFAMKLILEVLNETGITATAGIGTNLYLCKVAMDIGAKHIEPDKNGVRICTLDEMSYRKKLWSHTPITDFWRVGRGYATRLEKYNIFTMGDIARCSIKNESLLYDIFGINAELLIDHAWGYEPCTIKDIKNYKPENNCLSSGQVLSEPYPYNKAKIVILEMADAMSFELIEKKLVTNQIVIDIVYDAENIKNKSYGFETQKDWYGREIPKVAHGSQNLDFYTSSAKIIMENVEKLFDKIVNPDFTIRKIGVSANHVINENNIPKDEEKFEQMSFFVDYEKQEREKEEQEKMLKKEQLQQKAVLKIKGKYGKNAIVKGINMEDGATGRERNKQIGGHKA